MFPSEEVFAIGDWVALTEAGAKAYRKYQKRKFIAGGALVGAVALPLALPGAFLASVGIAGAGVGMAFTGGAQLAVGATGGAGLISVLENFLENNPEAKAIGIIKAEKRQLGQEGYKYSVNWVDGEVSGKSSWHPSIHLLRIEPPLASA